jgi:uncharacterized protein (DUF433 family)
MIATPKPSTKTEPLLGRGIYDVVEVARLVSRDPETVSRWTSGRSPLHSVESKPLYSFLDLISLWVVSELIERGVPKVEIRNGASYLAKELGTTYPLAHKALATVGGAVFGRFGDWVDVGKSGQLAFQDIIEAYLRPVEYGRDGLAMIWRPAEGVSINPRVQAGSPCVEGTRIPTAVLAALVAENEDQDDIAADYELSIAQVKAALTFEAA